MISNGLRWLLWKGQSTPKGSQLTTWEPVFYMVCARSLYSRGSCNFLIFFFCYYQPPMSHADFVKKENSHEDTIHLDMWLTVQHMTDCGLKRRQVWIQCLRGMWHAMGSGSLLHMWLCTISSETRFYCFFFFFKCIS